MLKNKNKETQKITHKKHPHTRTKKEHRFFSDVEKGGGERGNGDRTRDPLMAGGRLWLYKSLDPFLGVSLSLSLLTIFSRVESQEKRCDKTTRRKPPVDIESRVYIYIFFYIERTRITIARITTQQSGKAGSGRLRSMCFRRWSENWLWRGKAEAQGEQRAREGELKDHTHAHAHKLQEQYSSNTKLEARARRIFF